MNTGSYPKITAVMCAGLSGRERLAKAAIRSFCQQTYPNRELLVLNHSRGTDHESYLTGDDRKPTPGVVLREILTEKYPTLGDMRSAALDLVSSDTHYIVQWDDDDWSHPGRILRQYQALKEDGDPRKACTLGHQVRYSLLQNTAFRHSNQKSGIAGTIMHPHDGNRYQSEHGTEDSTFLKEHYLPNDRLVVLPNKEQPELYLRFFHGGNLCQRGHVMKTYARGIWHGCWVTYPAEMGYLPPPAREYLLSVLVSEYGHSELLTTMTSIACRHCDAVYAGEIRYGGQGNKRLPARPHRWKRLWENQAKGESAPFEGICRDCWRKNHRA